MTVQELTAFLKGMSVGIVDRAPTQEEWKALLDYVEKNQVSLQQALPNKYRSPSDILLGGYGHPGVPAFGVGQNTAARNY